MGRVPQTARRLRLGVEAALGRAEGTLALASDTAVRWRSLGALFAAGGTLALLACAVPGVENDHAVAVLGLGTAAVVFGVGLWLGAAWLDPRLMSPALGGGTLLITLGVLASGQPDGRFALLYIWVAFEGFYFLTRRQGFAHLATVAIAYGLALWALGGGLDQWLVVLGTATMTGWLVTALRARITRLAVHARRDPLTGLANRRAFDEALDRALQHAVEARDALSVLLVDLDRFKSLNDLHGHQAGDEALRRFGAVVAAACPGLEVARIGGDEFAVLTSEADDRAVHRIGRSICAAIGADDRLAGLGVQASVGIASYPVHAQSAKTLLHAADRALYGAKDGGGGRCVRFGPHLVAGAAAVQPRAHLQAILVLAETLDLRDARTAQHSQLVGRYAELIAHELGFPASACDRMRLAGIVHDLGKIAIPDAVLFKPGPLDEDEWDLVRRHPELGAQILAGAELDDLAAWVHAHHERPDGLGYPRALQHDEIPLEARILAVADAYEAMTADRPYRGRMSAYDAERELLTHRDTQFDPRVVDAFLAALSGRHGLRAAA